MPLELYTPGHNLVTDSLIMHGMVRYLVWAGGARHGSVERIGERFKIIIDDEIDEDKAKRTLKTLQELSNATIEREEPIGLIIKKIWASNVNSTKQNLRSWFDSLQSAIKEFKTIKIYADIDHAVSSNEGRRSSKVNSTVYLPLGPIYGKYLSKDYVVKENVQYMVCPTCFLLANMGLAYGVFILRINKGNRISSIMVSLVPSIKADLIDIMLVQRAFEYKYNEFNLDIPILAVPLIALSFGETLYAFENMDALIWVYEKSGNFMRIPNYIQVNIEGLLKTVSGIKYYIPQWPKILNECFLKNEDGPTILAKLNEAVINNVIKEHIYDIAREIIGLLNVKKDEKNVCRPYLSVAQNLVNALLET